MVHENISTGVYSPLADHVTWSKLVARRPVKNNARETNRRSSFQGKRVTAFSSHLCKLVISHLSML